MILLLEQTATIPILDADMEKCEELDDIITKCMLKAEKKCRKLFMGGVPFPPELVIHLNLINFWRIIIRKKGELLKSAHNYETTE